MDERNGLRVRTGAHYCLVNSRVPSKSVLDTEYSGTDPIPKPSQKQMDSSEAHR